MEDASIDRCGRKTKLAMASPFVKAGPEPRVPRLPEPNRNPRVVAETEETHRPRLGGARGRPLKRRRLRLPPSVSQACWARHSGVRTLLNFYVRRPDAFHQVRGLLLQKKKVRGLQTATMEKRWKSSYDLLNFYVKTNLS
jgi:hypothetical protein